MEYISDDKSCVYGVELMSKIVCLKFFDFGVEEIDGCDVEFFFKVFFWFFKTSAN